MIKHFITWDLGATKCSAGLIDYHQEGDALFCRKQHTIKLVDATSLTDLAKQIEEGLGVRMQDVDAVCIGGAGQYNGQILHLENGYPYPMNFAQTADEMNWPAFNVIHDYAPLVCATFTSYMHNPANIKRLNTCEIVQHGRRVAFGIGTGLGLKDGVMLQNGDFWLGRNEIGHIGISTPPAADEETLKRHHELESFLRASQVDQLSFEKVLSGQGLVRLHEFLHPTAASLTPEQIGDHIQANKLPELTELFAWYAGLFVGTVQLIFMPQGGIWIAGGVALKNLQIFDHPAFFDGIATSPCYQSLRNTYPLGVLVNPEHALIGGAHYAVKRLLVNEKITT